MRKTEKIKRVKARNSGYDESHPAFGSAVFTRRSGTRGQLHGSHLSEHSNTVALRISTSVRNHHLSADWYHPSEQIIEVEFSAAQFAELLTTMNTHAGTPCTIRSLNGKMTPEIPPDEVTEAERIEEAFTADLSEQVNSMKDIEDQISTILEKKSIGKADRHTIQNLVYQARRCLVESAPFAVQSFSEAREKVVVAAKAEIDAFMTHAIHSAGVKALADKQEEEGLESEVALLLEDQTTMIFYRIYKNDKDKIYTMTHKVGHSDTK